MDSDLAVARNEHSPQIQAKQNLIERPARPLDSGNALREDALYSTLKDLDVRSDDVPAFVALTTSKGTAELWDFNEGTMLYEFPRHGGRFLCSLR